MRRVAYLLMCLVIWCSLEAQTKIFKEVAEDMAFQFKPIMQDNTLVGYLAFTRLEKADADSFNYRVTIMDENLHDIGAINFRQENLDLQQVSFEQNVLCIGYVQSSLTGVESVRTKRAYKKAEDAAASSHILLQFINLNGKVLNTYYKAVSLMTETFTTRNPFSAMKLIGFLKFGMQIRNIPNKGFCFFYGDNTQQQLLIFDLGGNVIHEQATPDLADHYYLGATAQDIFLLIKKDVRVPEGGFRLYVFSSKDLSAENSFDLRDGYDNWLKVLTFDNDPVTGKAYIAGCIINPKMERQFLSAYDYSGGPYVGLFSLDLGGEGKDMHANCSYWSTESIPGINAEGGFTSRGFYVKYTSAFRDYSGNTIFTGTALRFVGSASFRLADGVFVRQDPSGGVTLDNTITCDESKDFGPTGILSAFDKKDFYKVFNPDTKTNYMIIDDAENIYIYNANSKKVMRTIPHKDGNIKTNVYPAKEGHIIVAEYNKKERTTRFSIESP
jgi:hypothetical protein